MKLLAHIDVGKNGLPNEGIQKLYDIYPAGKTPCGGFVCDLPAESVEVQRIMDILRPCTAPGLYQFQVHRLYEEADLSEARCLAMFPTEKLNVSNPPRDAAGRVILELEGIRYLEHLPTFTIGYAKTGDLVSETLKLLIEKQGFQGPFFSETVLAPSESVLRFSEPEPVWELQSRIVMPKLSNTHNLVHYGTEPFKGDYSRPIFVREPPFLRRSGEFHYRQDEVLALGPFDLAGTFEMHRSPRHTLIASQKFYQFCRSLELPIRWQPVRLDP